MSKQELIVKLDEWLKRNGTNLIWLIFVVALGVYLFVHSAQAAGEIIVDLPSPNAPITKSPLLIESRINESTSVDDTSARLICGGDAYPWKTLYLLVGVWYGSLDISNVPNGACKLQIRYIKLNDSPKDAVVNVNLDLSPQFGTITFTVRDSNYQPIRDVIVSPSGNRSGSDGVVTVGQQPLNQEINFTFTRTGYVPTYFHQTFTNTNIVYPSSVVMSKVGGDLREFDVIGYEQMMVGRGTFISVKDKYTGEKVDGAAIAIYDSANVKSLPGTTVNGRLFVSIQPTQSAGSYLMEVTKSGFQDFSVSFNVWAAPVTPTLTPTPTPAPTPTPVPTVSREWRPDVGQFLTNDEYRTWMEAQEMRRRNETLAQQQKATQPQTLSTFPYIPLALGIFALVTIGYKHREQLFDKIFGTKNNHNPSPIDRTQLKEDVIRHDLIKKDRDNNSNRVTVICDECDWKVDVDPEQVSKTMRDIMLDNHRKEVHS